MRIARKIMLLIAMALAAMAFTATTTSAQETEVEVIDEDTGNPCDPCSIHLEGESHIRAMPSGVIVLRCHDEYSFDIYHDGSGEIEWVGGPHGAPGCNILNCTVSNPHWTVSRLGERATGGEHLYLNFCFRVGPSGPELVCEHEVNVAEQAPADSHHYELTAPPIVCAGGARIIEGMWETENDGNQNDMEIIHHS
jgi:hypothetical protein